MSGAAEPILKVEGLKKYFPIKAGVFSRVVGLCKSGRRGRSFDQ